jgi:hypothetical protein
MITEVIGRWRCHGKSEKAGQSQAPSAAGKPPGHRPGLRRIPGHVPQWLRAYLRGGPAGSLSGQARADARAALEEEIFGKHVLITDHDDWPANLYLLRPPSQRG